MKRKKLIFLAACSMLTTLPSNPLCKAEEESFVVEEIELQDPSPLETAIEEGNFEQAKKLLTAKNINTPAPSSNETPLMLSVIRHDHDKEGKGRKGSIAFIEYLLASGATPGKDGAAMVYYAMHSKDHGLAELFAHKVVPRYKNKLKQQRFEGSTLLELLEGRLQTAKQQQERLMKNKEQILQAIHQHEQALPPEEKAAFSDKKEQFFKELKEKEENLARMQATFELVIKNLK